METECIREEKIASFVAFTGADPTSAQQYLEATEWQLEAAVNIFMEAGGGSPHMQSMPSPPRAAASSSASSSAPTTRAQAKSLAFEDDGIRAPDPSKRQRLVNDDFEDRMGILSAQGFHPAAAEQLHDPFRDFRAEAAALASSVQFGSGINSDFSNSGLAGIFQPPISILYRGTFADARQEAKQQKKWLLVNLQSTTIFESHTLNRDTWSDDVLQNVIASAFIFWQNYDSNEDGRTYSARYHVDALPHIAIIDPRTAEKMVEWSGFIEARDLIEKISDFCEHHSLESFQPHRKLPARQNYKVPITERSENEQLEAAIAASLNDENMMDVQSRTVSIIDDDSDSDEIIQPEPKPAKEQFPLSDEPPEGAEGATRVQIRTADGQRIVRRFLKSEPVGVLFTLVKQQVPNATDGNFQLRTAFPPVAIEAVATTIADARLENASLNMQWL